MKQISDAIKLIEVQLLEWRQRQALPKCKAVLSILYDIRDTVNDPEETYPIVAQAAQDIWGDVPDGLDDFWQLVTKNLHDKVHKSERIQIAGLE